MFPPHPTSAAAVPGKSRTSEICVEVIQMNTKREKTSWTLSAVIEEGLPDFNNF